MGKASRELNLAREAIYKKEETQNNTGEFRKPTDLLEEHTAYEVLQKMSEYTSDNSYALCEYLDLININNFIYWCKTR